jgi:hypothetical protein
MKKLVYLLWIFLISMQFFTLSDALGAGWTEMNTGIKNVSLYDVWGTSPNDVYAVGVDYTDGTGIILHYNGTQWTVMESGLQGGAYAIWGTSSSDIYVTSNNRILHYDGTEWASMSGGNFYAQAIWGSSPNDIFAVYDGIRHYNGSSWFLMFNLYGVGFISIWGTSSNDVFAGGYPSQSGIVPETTLFHYDGATWTPMPSGVHEQINAIWGSSPTDVFAAGAEDKVYHYDGFMWSPPTYTGIGNINDMWGSSAKDIYVIGGGIAHFDGYGWSNFTPRFYNLRGVWGSSPTDVFVVGDIYGAETTILHYDGSPTCVNVKPEYSNQGKTLDLYITGLQTNFISFDSTGSSVDSTTVSFGCAEITVNSTTVVSLTEVVANITLSPDAQLGSCAVTVTTGSEKITCLEGFDVKPLDLTPPEIGAVTAGNCKLRIAITDNVELDLAHSTVAVKKSSTGEDITSLLIRTDYNQITQGYIDFVEVPAGSYVLEIVAKDLANNESTATRTAEVVNCEPESCVGVDPKYVVRGQEVALTITGKNTNFDSTSMVFIGSNGPNNLTLNSRTVNSATNITLDITIASDAAAQKCDVAIITSGEVIQCLGFEIVESIPPTAITLSGFKAEGKNKKVIISWTTEAEIENVGFNLYRSESQAGGYVKINSSIIPANGSPIKGAYYEFIDNDVKNRKTYFYKLEDIDLNGKATMHGPVSALPRWIYGIDK